MKNTLPLFFLLFFCTAVWDVKAQRKTVQVEAPSAPKKKVNNQKVKATTTPAKSTQVLVKKDSDQLGTWAIGIGTATNSGIIGGLNLRKTWGKRKDKSLNLINVDFAHIKDYREFTSPFSYNGQTYIEGKLNYLYTVRPEYGKEITLLKKASQGGPALKGIFSTGPTIGLQAPYMVDIAFSSNNPFGQSTVSVPLKDLLENKYPSAGVIRESGMFSSLGKASIVPGWHLKSAINIEFNSEKSSYMAIEAGFIIDVFNNPIEMLNQSTQRPVYTTAYLTFLLGKTK
jgi:hypothetical protein